METPALPVGEQPLEVEVAEPDQVPGPQVEGPTLVEAEEAEAERLPVVAVGHLFKEVRAELDQQVQHQRQPERRHLVAAVDRSMRLPAQALQGAA